ncbi:uncharacterized protein [Haliotis cracherodii]|uniref:uncharacterized protein n=1 Tax=Haliotis cracherodii TaxID=6455 RepID=UPI0039E9A390
MKYAHKMVLVPEDTWQSLQATEQRHRQTLHTPLLEKKRLQNLEQMDTLMQRSQQPFHMREQEYNQLLQHMLELQRQQHNSNNNKALQPKVTPPSSPSTMDTTGRPAPQQVRDEVVMSVPKAKSSKAMNLMTRIQNNPDLSWTPEGILTIEGEPVPGTHMVDLINNLVRHRKTKEGPGGWTILSHHLANSHVPHEIIGNPQRWQWMQKQQQQQHHPHATPETTITQFSLPKFSQQSHKERRRRGRRQLDPQVIEEEEDEMPPPTSFMATGSTSGGRKRCDANPMVDDSTSI